MCFPLHFGGLCTQNYKFENYYFNFELIHEMLKITIQKAYLC